MKYKERSLLDFNREVESKIESIINLLKGVIYGL